MEKPRSNERERIKAEKMFDKALLTLQNLKESPEPLKPTRAPKNLKADPEPLKPIRAPKKKAIPPSPPPQLDEEAYSSSSEDDEPVVAKSKPVMDAQQKRIIFS